MPISEDELQALQSIPRKEIDHQISPFRVEVNQRFDQVLQQLDGLYKKNETREQEYLSIKHQIERLEANR